MMSIDLYLVEGLLTEEQRAVRDSVRSFVEHDFLPLIKNCHRDGKFPFEVVPKMAELGIFGAHISGYECAGLDHISYGLMMQELERGDSGLRSFASVQSSLSMTAIYKFGSEEQKRYWLPRMAKAEKLGCFALTEPDFGSNPAGMRMKAIKDGKHYILNGTKMWITNGSIADVTVVWAKTNGDPQSIRGFLVEKGTLGFSASDIKGKFSMRASVTSELHFDDCKIPEENILPKTEGLKSALTCLNSARYSIVWGAIGAAMACFTEALSYAKERVQFSKPIAGHQLVQQKLTWMAVEITKAQLLAWRLGSMLDKGEGKYWMISIAKMNNVWMALETARLSRDILAASGITDEYQTIRHLLNLETVKTYEGTHDIHTLIIGEALTGLSAFE